MHDLREDINRKTFTWFLDCLEDLDPILDVGRKIFRAFEHLRFGLCPVRLNAFVQFAAYSSVDTRAFQVETECIKIDLGIAHFHPFAGLWKGFLKDFPIYFEYTNLHALTLESTL